MAGCVNTVAAMQDDPIFMFNREYYALKDLTAEDVWKLKEINASNNTGAAKASGLMLGHYYVRHNDIGKGDLLIKDNLDDSYLDKFMRVNGHLWAYDAAIKTGDTDRAAKERDYLSKIEMDPKVEKSFKVYCAQENITYKNDPRACVQIVNEEKESFALPPAPQPHEEIIEPAAKPMAKVEPETEPKQTEKADGATASTVSLGFPMITAPDPDMLQPTTLPEVKKAAKPEEPKAEPAKTEPVKADIAPTQDIAPVKDTDTVIDLDSPEASVPKSAKIKTTNTGRKVAVVEIENSVKNPDIIEAMLYSISKLKVNIDLDFEGGKPVYDYMLDAENKTITQNNDTVDFSFDKKAQMEKAARIIIQSGAKIVAIGYSDGLRDTAEEVADDYKNKAQFFVFNMQDKDFQNKLKSIKAKAGNGIVSYILAGTQEQALKVVPFLKYYSPRPDKTIIVAAINNLTRKFYTGDYADYTYNAIVITDIMIAGNPSAEKFANDFTRDFGKSPAVSDLLGYDMLVYMEKKRNPSFPANYLTGITKIENGQVYRKTSAYRIIGGGKLRSMDN